MDKESLSLTDDSQGKIRLLKQEARGKRGRLYSVANQPEPYWLDSQFALNHSQHQDDHERTKVQSIKGCVTTDGGENRLGDLVDY